MKIVILSRKSSLYSTQALVDAGKAAGHTVEVINPLRCYMNITSHSPSIHYKGESVDNVDAVIPRIGASITFFGCAVVRQFEMMGVYSLNESIAITRLARQAAQPPAPLAQGHRPARHRVRQLHQVHRRPHRPGRRRAPGGQAP